MKTSATLAMLTLAGLFVAGCQTDPLIIEKHYTENTQVIEAVDSPVVSAHGAQAPKTRGRMTTLGEQVESEKIILR